MTNDHPVCEVCGEPIPPKVVPDRGSPRLYCGLKCKRRAQNQRYYQKHRKSIIKRVLHYQWREKPLWLRIRRFFRRPPSDKIGRPWKYH